MTPHRHAPAKKRFGQNFLRDNNVVARMLSHIDPKPSDHFVEIGPGLGALTVPLLIAVRRLEAVELDRDLIPHLRQICRDHEELVLHEADALTFDFSSLAHDNAGLRVVGNLPYNISTPLIFHLLGFSDQVHDMHFTLQKEVVDRLAARPGNAAYGRLSVMVQYHCRVEALFTIAPEVFRPVPKVESAFVRLTTYPTLPFRARDAAALASVVAKAFGQRRKTLKNALDGLLTSHGIEAALVDPGARAETLSVADFVRLADRLTDEP